MTPRRSRSAQKERRLSHLNWMEMGELVPRRVHTLLLPVGTLEAHGITSLGTDNVIPTRLSEALAERLNAIVAPTIPFGVTAHLGALAGGEASLRVKLGDALFAAARQHGLLARSQLFDRMATGQGLDLPAQGDGTAGSAIL